MTVGPDRAQALWGHAAMLGFSALVAGSFSLGALVARDVDPGVLMLLRFALATVLMAGVVRIVTGAWPSVPQAPWRYLLLGGSFALYFVLMFEGLQTAQAVSAAAVFTLTPVMSALIARPLLQQRSPWPVWAALALGAGGAIWVIFEGDPVAMAGFDIGPGEAIYALGCLSHALYTPLSRRLNRGESALEAAFGVMAGGTLVLLIYALPRVESVDWGSVASLVWVTLAYLVVVTTAGTTTLIQFATLRLPSSKVMAYTYLVPSWVILWDLALGQSAPPSIILPGIAVTLLALAVLLRRD